MRRSGKTFLLALGVTTLFACSTLPEYAAPKARVIDPSKVDMSDVISYRKLRRADFKGAQPPPEFSGPAGRIGAATCAYILTTPDTQLRIEPTRARDGSLRYRATPHHLRFDALMDRNCSWWNPKNVGIPKAYILEHEQIHFALFELEARRLNASVAEIAARMDATSETLDGAGRAAQQQLEGEVQKRLKKILARSREFDEDTSMGHAPEQQKKWWQRVQAELAAAP